MDRFKEILDMPDGLKPKSEMRPIIEPLLQAEETLKHCEGMVCDTRGGNFCDPVADTLQAIDKFRKGEREGK